MLKTKTKRPGYRRTIALILFISLAVSVVIALYYAPALLVYSTFPTKSDAIFIFPGKGQQEKEQLARELIQADYSRRIIDAGLGRQFLFADQLPATGVITHIQRRRINIDDQVAKLMKESEVQYDKMENTHHEVFFTRFIMEKMDFKSAILMSSPLHMRRIKIMSDSVFEGTDYKLSFVPSNHFDLRGFAWLGNKRQRMMVVTEYIKIIYYYAYTWAPFLFD